VRSQSIVARILGYIVFVLMAVWCGLTFGGFLYLVTEVVVPFWSATLVGSALAALLTWGLRSFWQRKVPLRTAEVLRGLMLTCLSLFVLEGMQAYTGYPGRGSFASALTVVAMVAFWPVLASLKRSVGH
jgi:hypothetical protein